MKIKKHEVTLFVKGYPVEKRLYTNKQRALNSVRKLNDDYYFKYTGEVEVDLYCEGCDKELTLKDTYLKVDECTRYCSDCYEENSFIYYTVGGEQVGDENDAEVYEGEESE